MFLLVILFITRLKLNQIASFLSNLMGLGSLAHLSGSKELLGIGLLR